MAEDENMFKRKVTVLIIVMIILSYFIVMFIINNQRHEHQETPAVSDGVQNMSWGMAVEKEQFTWL